MKSQSYEMQQPAGAKGQQRVSTITHQPGSHSVVNVQPHSYQQGLAGVGTTIPSWNCILIETILGMICCCFVLGLVGLIFAILGNSNNDPKYLRWAHQLGLASIIVGVVAWIIYIIIFFIYIIAVVYDLKFNEYLF